MHLPLLQQRKHPCVVVHELEQFFVMLRHGRVLRLGVVLGRGQSSAAHTRHSAQLILLLLLLLLLHPCCPYAPLFHCHRGHVLGVVLGRVIAGHVLGLLAALGLQAPWLASILGRVLGAGLGRGRGLGVVIVGRGLGVVVCCGRRVLE